MTNAQTKFNGSCDTCNRPLMGAVTTGGTGYASDDLARRHCYECCADHDRAYMRAKGKVTLYLVAKVHGATADTVPTARTINDQETYRKQWAVTNWCGTFERTPFTVRRSTSYGFGRSFPRYDAWFAFEGFVWHCVNKGDMQIARCKRTKERV